MKINNIDELEEILKLVTEYQLDSLTVDNIIITKTKHNQLIDSVTIPLRTLEEDILNID